MDTGRQGSDDDSDFSVEYNKTVTIQSVMETGSIESNNSECNETVTNQSQKQTQSQSPDSDTVTQVTQSHRSGPPSKTRKKKCRICKSLILVQNFSSHMSTVHHTNDTREHGQRSIFQSLGASAKSSKMKEAEAQRQPEVSSKETSDHAPSEEVEEIQAVIPDNPNLVSPRKRMREENGGISEQHSTSTELEKPPHELGSNETKLILEKIESLENEIKKLSLSVEHSSRKPAESLQQAKLLIACRRSSPSCHLWDKHYSFY